MREEAIVTTPTPPPTPRRVENVGRRSELSGKSYFGVERTIDWGDEEKIFVRPFHQGAHSDSMPSALTGYL